MCLDCMNARWVLIVQKFTFVFRHRTGFQNKVADSLSRRAHLFTVLSTKIIGFEAFPDQYEHDEDFGFTWQQCVSFGHIMLISTFLMAIVFRAINFAFPVVPFMNTSFVIYIAMDSPLTRDATRLSFCWLSTTFGPIWRNRLAHLCSIVQYAKRLQDTIRTLVCILHFQF